ncbi:hypothetical protein Dimus_036328, partial [Dionaea muscipula]
QYESSSHVSICLGFVGLHTLPAACTLELPTECHRVACLTESVMRAAGRSERWVLADFHRSPLHRSREGGADRPCPPPHGEGDARLPLAALHCSPLHCSPRSAAHRSTIRRSLRRCVGFLGEKDMSRPMQLHARRR